MDFLDNYEEEVEVMSQNEDTVSLDYQSELIALVRENDSLYNKKNPKYMDTLAKADGWAIIGAQLTPSLTGPEAKKEFYKLRQRFGKERHKVMDSMPRSGAGANCPTYVPSWPLYQEMMFLTDHIHPINRTSSNYSRKANKSANVPITRAMSPSVLRAMNPCVLAPRAINISTIGRPFAPQAVPGSGKSLLRCKSPQIFQRCSTPIPGDQLQEFARNNPTSAEQVSTTPVLLSDDSQQSTSNQSNNEHSYFNNSGKRPVELFRALGSSTDEDTSTSQFGDLDVSEIEVPSSVSETSKRKLLSCNTRPQKLAPPPDASCRSKKAEADAMAKSILTSTNTLSSLVANVGAAIQRQTEEQGCSKSKFPPAVEGMLQSVGFALSKVAEEDHLACVIDMLTLVQSKYVKK